MRSATASEIVRGSARSTITTESASANSRTGARVRERERAACAHRLQHRPRQHERNREIDVRGGALQQPEIVPGPQVPDEMHPRRVDVVLRQRPRLPVHVPEPVPPVHHPVLPCDHGHRLRIGAEDGRQRCHELREAAVRLHPPGGIGDDAGVLGHEPPERRPPRRRRGPEERRCRSRRASPKGAAGTRPGTATPGTASGRSPRPRRRGPWRSARCAPARASAPRAPVPARAPQAPPGRPRPPPGTGTTTRSRRRTPPPGTRPSRTSRPPSRNAPR